MTISIEAPLDLTDPNASDFLENLQGNILRGHGRDYAAHLLLRTVGAPADVRRWISEFARTQVTTALNSRDLADVWRADGGAGEPFACIALSHTGYEFLEVDAALIPNAAGPFKRDVDDLYFRMGMKNQSDVPGGRSFNDPPSGEWETPYQGDVDALVILGDDDAARLSRRVDALRAELAGLYDVLAVENGSKLTATFPRGELVIEHFGFQDGISQPILIKQKIEEDANKRGDTHWSPAAPLSLALAPDPSGGYGSFLVFRKLEQNVLGFTRALDDGATAIGISADAVGAMAVGRTRDGIALFGSRPSDPTVDPNDFHFDQDPDGTACPLHAHIRKTNPRGDINRFLGGSQEFERARRVVRRGITFGDRPDLSNGGEPPENGVGLLFMCYQANLDGFIIQQEGSDDNDFVRAGTGPDAVIGQNAAPSPQTWPSSGGPVFTMANFVRMLGGEYFFTPSMTFLLSLQQQ